MKTESEISTRSRLGLLIYGMTNAVLFGIGITLVVSIESLSERAWTLIPLVIVLSLILAWPIAWFIAPRLRQPLWRRRQLAEAGRPVGTPQERQRLVSQGSETATTGSPRENRRQ
jgi:peptidoglycan/LPS O-acetylase OafA/YrhL